VHLARAIGGDHHDGTLGGANGPEFGNGHLKIREELQQVPFEFFVRPIQFVDEQDRGAFVRRLNRLQQRSLDEERLREKIVTDMAARGRGVTLAQRCLEQANLEDLTRVVPFVHRVGDVEAFVALQTDE
jgi:hypothetical protein